MALEGAHWSLENIVVKFALWFLGILGALVIGGVASNVASVVDQPVVQGALLIGAPIAAVVVFYSILSKYFSHLVHYPYVSKRFSVVVQEMKLYWATNDSIEFIKNKKLRALRGNQESYLDTYRWTGSGNIEMNSLVPEQTLKQEDRRSIWQTYRIEFARHVPKRGYIDTSVCWKIKDTGDSAPFMSTTVEEPTEKIIFYFIPKHPVSKVFFEEKFSISAKEPFYTIEINPNESGEYVKIVENPKLYYYYELRWVPAA